MPDSLEFVDRQWESRNTASILIAEAIDSLMAQGLSEYDAIGALEDALQTRRIIINLQITQD